MITYLYPKVFLIREICSIVAPNNCLVHSYITTYLLRLKWKM